MVFPLLWKGVRACKIRFGCSNHLGDRSIHNNKPMRSTMKLEAP